MPIKRAAQFTLFSLFLASGAYASSDFNLTPGVTSISHDIYQLHMTIFYICVAIGIVVFGAMFYAMIYHRKSLGAKAALFHEHLWLEITWTVIPFLILVSMAIPATLVLIHMHDDALPDLTIKVTGYQWKWQYDYLNQSIKFFSNTTTPYNQIYQHAAKDSHYLRTVDHPLVVPIHQKIRFLITSNDVIHGWWVPDLGVKHDAVPGFIYESWARINRPGIYYGQCSKLCGLNHAFMPIVVQAVTEKEFATWVAQQKGEAPPVTETVVQPKVLTTPTTTTSSTLSKEDLMKRGETVFLNTCAVCHKPDGSGMPPVFPALKADKTTTGPIAAHIDTVLNGRPGTAMQAFKEQLSDEDIAAVITYERNAFGNNMNDSVQPADISSAKAKGNKP